MAYISSSNREENFLEEECEYTLNGKTCREFGFNEYKIHIWEDGKVSVIRNTWGNQLSADLRNLRVEDGRLMIDICDLVNVILQKVPMEELTDSLLTDAEVRSQLVYKLAHRFSDGMDDNERRKFLLEVNSQIWDEAIDRLVMKMTEVETQLRAKTQYIRYQRTEFNLYKGLYEWCLNSFLYDDGSERARKLHTEFLSRFLSDEKLVERFPNDPLLSQSIGKDWQETRAYWRSKLEEVFAEPNDVSKFS